MKYIIEVPEDRVVDGFLRLPGVMEDVKSHWIETGIRATPYEEPSDTAEDAWKMICHVLKYVDDGGMSLDNLEECFGTNNLSHIGEMSYVEVREMYEAWKKQKEEIHVGDEVAFHFDDGRPDTIVVVTYIGEDGYIDGMNDRGTLYAHKYPKNWTKTGRTFPEVAELLKKMRKSE